jgi:hypothetical protein
MLCPSLLLKQPATEVGRQHPAINWGVDLVRIFNQFASKHHQNGGASAGTPYPIKPENQADLVGYLSGLLDGYVSII